MGYLVNNMPKIDFFTCSRYPFCFGTIEKRKLTQKEAAQRCGTDQPTLSKVLRGRMESVTLGRLTAWLTALGRTVEIHVRPYDARAKTGYLVAAP